MAKNYTIKEACEVIANGTDLEAIADLGRRYPILLNKVTKLATKAGDEFIEFMGFMPEYLTANKVNTSIKKLLGEETGETSDADAETETEVETEAPVDAAQWNENMSAKQLWDVLGKAGKRKLAKSTKKTDLIEACKQAFGATDTEDADEADEVEETAGKYDGKSAMELFKECKKRGIKAEAKKPAKYYADLLTADDNKSDETESEDESWDEEVEEEKPAKSTKPDKKKETKKEAKPDKKAPAKKADDDGDDWDI